MRPVLVIPSATPTADQLIPLSVERTTSFPEAYMIFTSPGLNSISSLLPETARVQVVPPLIDLCIPDDEQAKTILVEVGLIRTFRMVPEGPLPVDVNVLPAFIDFNKIPLLVPT